MSRPMYSLSIYTLDQKLHDKRKTSFTQTIIRPLPSSAEAQPSGTVLPLFIVAVHGQAVRGPGHSGCMSKHVSWLLAGVCT